MLHIYVFILFQFSSSVHSLNCCQIVLSIVPEVHKFISVQYSIQSISFNVRVRISSVSVSSSRSLLARQMSSSWTEDVPRNKILSWVVLKTFMISASLFFVDITLAGFPWWNGSWRIMGWYLSFDSLVLKSFWSILSIFSVIDIPNFSKSMSQKYFRNPMNNSPTDFWHRWDWTIRQSSTWSKLRYSMLMLCLKYFGNIWKKSGSTSGDSATWERKDD